jgi:DtxR family Mn-dependent transcriptional regulator
MYVLQIALLAQDQEESPVPISRLAEQLEISPVSVNQMCRKLERRDLLEYAPYRGVTLTALGQSLADRVIRRRRLWEVFLVRDLGLELDAASDIACRFEHVTPDDVADRLAAHLGNPTRCPHKEPIPPGPSDDEERPLMSLAGVAAGESARLVGLDATEAATEFLNHHGVSAGAEVLVMAVADDGSLLLQMGEKSFSVSQPMAERIEVRLASATVRRVRTLASADQENTV